MTQRPVRHLARPHPVTGESTAPPGAYVRDPLVVTLTATDTAGATATTTQILVFSQQYSSDSRANCPKPSPFSRWAYAKIPRVALVTGTKASVTVPCALRYDCAGRFTVFRVPGARGAAKGKKPRRTTLASSKFFSIPAGQRMRVPAKLSRAGRRLVRGKRRVRASLQVASVDPLGKTTTRTFGVRISSRRRGGR